MICERVGPPKVHGKGPNLHGVRKVHGTEHGEVEFTGIISPTEAGSNDCLKSHTYISCVGRTASSREAAYLDGVVWKRTTTCNSLGPSLRTGARRQWHGELEEVAA